jgi:hypothetical protein
MSVKLVTYPQVTVATAGTEQRVVSAPVDKALKLFITAPAANTGSVFIGDSSVSSTRGITVIKGTTLELSLEGEYIDVHNIWADVATNGDKLDVAVLVRA